MTSAGIPINSAGTPAETIVRTDAARSTRNGSATSFDACLKAAVGKHPKPASCEACRVPIPPDGRIRLGVVSSTDPTVSHLLVKNPSYSADCWKIIHSDSNRDNPYTRIPAGTAIYMDSESGEITWDGHSRKGERPDLSGPAAAEVSGDSRKLSAGERLEIDRAVSRAAAAYNLPRELIHSVIRAESDFQVRAVSPAGARGLMQLMPETARELGVGNPFDIRQNIDGGARYLRKMLDLFDGNIEQALAAYNAGPGTIRRHHGRIPYPETRLYVQRVLALLAENAAV